MKKNYQLPNKLLLTIALAGSLFSGVAIAQPGTNDPTFNIPDSGPNSIYNGSNDLITGSAIQANDKKVILIGRFSQFNAAPASHIVRLNAKGNTDANFNTGTGFNFDPTTLVIQDNNRVVVGGNFTSYNGTTANRIVRLLSNGSIDNSFVTGTGFDNDVTSILLQANGKLVVAGKFDNYNGTAVNHIIRLNKNGTLDNTFNLTGIANTTPQQIALLPDGKIILAYGKPEEVDLYRLNTNGSVDNTYLAQIPVKDPIGVETYFPKVIALRAQADGKVLVGGSYFFGGSPTFNFLARAAANGDVDSTFNSPFVDEGGAVNTISLQSDGKILVGAKGDLTSDAYSTSKLLRLNPDGSIDNTFFHNNTLHKYGLGVFTTAIQSDGKIVVAGLFPEFNTYTAYNITRLNTDGSIDISFNKVSAANGDIKVSALQANGRILIGGNFSAYHYQSRNHIARLRENGTLDNSFNPGTGTNGVVTAIAVQANNKILIAGNFTTYNNQPVPGIVRVNSNGSIDATFNVGTGTNGVINTLAIQNNKKIIIAGNFTDVNGTARTGVARLNTNGSVDAGFTSPITLTTNDDIFSSLILPSGKIMIGGKFEASGSSTQRNNLVRLNTNGTLDAGFQQASVEFVRTIALQTDGKILVGGGYEPDNFDMGYGYVTRINSDGSSDFTFNTGSLPGETFPIYSLTYLSSGNIIAGGHFTGYGSGPALNIMQLDSTGTVDTAFVGTANATVYTTQLTGDGKIILGGAFNEYAGVARNHIARIIVTAPPVYGAAIEAASTATATPAFTVYPNPAAGSVQFDNLEVGGIITIRNVYGSIVHKEQISNSKATLNLSGYANGIYFITQEGNGKMSMQKLVVSNN